MARSRRLLVGLAILGACLLAPSSVLTVGAGTFEPEGQVLAPQTLQAPIGVQAAMQQAKLTAADGGGYDNFGFPVVISGNTAVVGAYHQGSYTGAAYIFVRSGTTWTEQAKLTASDAAILDDFGFSVAFSGSTAVVGAMSKNSATGAAYVFVRSGTSWTQQAKLTASDGAAGDLFGSSVAIAGSTAVVTAVDKKSLTGADQVGAAYVFVRSGTIWTQQAKLTASDGAAYDQFGYAVAISGSTAIVGADGKNSGTGAAYVFVRSGTTWKQEAELTAADGASNDQLGLSVAMSNSTVVVGAVHNGSVKGAAYVFVGSGTSWSQQAKLTASDVASGGEFGVSVAISGSTVVVGADRQRTFTGAAYVFVRSGPTWSHKTKLTASDGVPNDGFGRSVAISGSTVVVGALNNSLNGAAYVYLLR